MVRGFYSQQSQSQRKNVSSNAYQGIMGNGIRGGGRWRRNTTVNRVQNTYNRYNRGMNRKGLNTMQNNRGNVNNNRNNNRNMNRNNNSNIVVGNMNRRQGAYNKNNMKKNNNNNANINGTHNQNLNQNQQQYGYRKFGRGALKRGGGGVSAASRFRGGRGGRNYNNGGRNNNFRRNNNNNNAGRGRRRNNNNNNNQITAESLDDALDKYMGEDAVKSRLDGELDAYFSRNDKNENTGMDITMDDGSGAL